MGSRRSEARREASQDVRVVVRLVVDFVCITTNVVSASLRQRWERRPPDEKMKVLSIVIANVATNRFRQADVVKRGSAPY